MRTSLKFFLSTQHGIRGYWSVLRTIPQFISLNISLSSLLLLGAVSILSGIQLALLIFFIRQRAMMYRGSALGFIAVLLGMAGIGCATCGSIALSSLVGLSATYALAGYLPGRGIEFSIAGIILMLISIYLTSRKLQEANLCRL